MKIAIIQPYFFPYLPYFQLIHAADTFVSLDDVSFIRRGWVNRNRILVGDRTQYLTIPCRHSPLGTNIRHTEPDLTESDRAKMLETVRRSYQRSAFSRDIIPLIERALTCQAASIADIALASIKEVCTYLGINTRIITSSSQFSGTKSKGAQRIMEICKSQGATHYINAIGGTDLYSSDAFERENITLSFLKSTCEEHVNFPLDLGLSTIHVLMNCSREYVISLLDKYSLV